MAQLTECDAPDCSAVHRPSGEPWPWYSAVIQLQTPAELCENDEYEVVSWGWSQNGVRVDACSLAHMRIALAVKIADLTDEPATNS